MSNNGYGHLKQHHQRTDDTTYCNTTMSTKMTKRAISHTCEGCDPDRYSNITCHQCHHFSFEYYHSRTPYWP